MSEDENKKKDDPPMNDKVLLFSIVGLLAVGFISVLFIAVPWILHGGEATWKEYVVEDLVILLTLVMFVFGFYNNTRMH